LSASDLAQLALLPLAGNVRELENLLHRAVALGDGQTLQFDTLPQGPTRTQPAPLTSTLPTDSNAALDLPNDLQTYLDDLERNILSQALQDTGFNRTAAAERLGLSLRQMRYRIARLRIDAPNTSSAPLDAQG
jgi:two-component system response regulator PilR (NtrC family)